MTVTDQHGAVQACVDGWADRLVALSHTIHDHPETAFEERRAASAVAGTLRSAGFEVEVGAYGLPTAIEATYGFGEVTVVVCAEYDALPEIGHACGHNIIAAAGTGAAIALARVAHEVGIRVKLLGTPAEEHGGGKVLMLRAGAWDDATFSLMVHPGPAVDMRCQDWGSLAVARLEVDFYGRSAHAGIDTTAQTALNAADAVTLSLVAIGLLRQQLPSTWRVGAFAVEAGRATNVIPDLGRIRAEVRAPDMASLQTLRERVLACFAGAATATGCTWSHGEEAPAYDALRHEPAIADAWNDAMALLGRPTVAVPGVIGGSTDMGNVSQVVPSIHPVIAIPEAAGLPHHAEFTTDAIRPGADRAVHDGALALAWTVLSVVTEPDTRADLLSRQASRTAPSARFRDQSPAER